MYEKNRCQQLHGFAVSWPMLLLVAMPFGITDTGFYDMLTY